MEAIWDCACQLWVPGRSRVHGRPYLSFLPHNSATLQFQVLMSMQMDAYLKKEQIGTLFVRVGALGDGYWGGGCQGPPNQKIGLTSNPIFLAPPA